MKHSARVQSSEPIQLILLLDLASDNPISLDDVRRHLPDKREDRIVLTLSGRGVSRTPRGAPRDWVACSEAVARMVADARARLCDNGPLPHFYVAGRAALPVFAQLGIELSKWAKITAINQRPDKQWDVFPLREANAPKFFYLVRGLDTDLPSEADGRVAVHVSTGREAPREKIRTFLREQGERHAGLVEVRAGGKQTAVLDASSAPAAIAELVEIFARIPDVYPRRSGLALFLDGPATLALIAGRAINPNVLQDIWIPNFDGEGYRPAVTLPWKGVVTPSIGTSSDDELARTRLLRDICDEIEELKKRLTVNHLPPLLSPDAKLRFVERLRAIEVCREPEGEAFELSVAERRLTFGPGLLEGLRHAREDLRVQIGVTVLLHELFHFDQHLHSTTYRGIGRAGFVLEEVDFWADTFAIYTLAKLEISRRGEEGRENARDIATRYVDVGLAGIEAFDRFEQGTRIERLYERRLRRYLIWYLQRARAQALASEGQLWDVFGHRIVVELSLLQCHLDERSDKLVLGARAETELMVAIGGQLLRMPKSPIFDPATLIQHVRDFNTQGLYQAMAAVRDHHRSVLVPWVT